LTHCLVEDAHRLIRVGLGDVERRSDADDVAVQPTLADGSSVLMSVLGATTPGGDNQMGGGAIATGGGTPPPVPVGGIVVPVNRLGLVAPWLGLAALVSLAGLTVALVRRRKITTK